MISSAALSSCALAQPPAGLHGYPRRAAEVTTPASSSAVPSMDAAPSAPAAWRLVPGGTAEAPNSSQARPACGAPDGPRTEPVPPTSHGRNTLPMANIQQPTDNSAQVPPTVATLADLKTALGAGWMAGYAAGLVDARAGA